MSTEEIKKLQDNLVKQGYMTQAEVNTGYGIYGPKTTEAMNKAVAEATKTHPKLSTLTKSNSAEDIVNAYLNNDWSGVSNSAGQPFSAFDQQEAYNNASAALEPYYTALKDKETKDTEATLKQKQLDYQNYLATSGEKFQTEKTNLDQNAADKGVLFSGGRIQKQKALENSYNTDQAYKAATVGASIGNTARDYQYKYGNDEANNLSSYYGLGGNTYNAGVATGGVGSSGLSSIYSPSASTYQGTTVN